MVGLERTRREFVDGSVEPEGFYSYRIFADDGDRLSGPSRAASATTPPVPAGDGLTPLTSRRWVIPTTANVPRQVRGNIQDQPHPGEPERGGHRGHGQAVRNPGAGAGENDLAGSRYLPLLEQFSGYPLRIPGGRGRSSSRPRSPFRSLRSRYSSIRPAAGTPPLFSTSPRRRYSIPVRP